MVLNMYRDVLVGKLPDSPTARKPLQLRQSPLSGPEPQPTIGSPAAQKAATPGLGAATQALTASRRQLEAAKLARQAMLSVNAANLLGFMGAGGDVSGFPTSGWGSKPHVAAYGHMLTSQFGNMRIGGFAKSGHVKRSYHYVGQALDVSGSRSQMDQVFNRAYADLAAGNRNQVIQVIYKGRGYSNRGKGVYSWKAKGHENHVHISFGPYQ